MQAFALAHPAVPIYLLDVVTRRVLSGQLAARLAVRHESPQVILLRPGAICWTGSHHQITAAQLAGQVEAAGFGAARNRGGGQPVG